MYAFPYFSSKRDVKFNKDNAKLGHFKMNSCSMNIVHLYRMVGMKEIKFACISMKLNDVAPFVISKARELHGKQPKDLRKICKSGRKESLLRTGL